MLNDNDPWGCSSPEQLKELAQEGFILAVTEEIWAAMDRRERNKMYLAERLGTGKSYISQMLSGSRNMTLRTLSDVAAALEQRITITLSNVDERLEWAHFDGTSKVQSNKALRTMEFNAVNDGLWTIASEPTEQRA